MDYLKCRDKKIHDKQKHGDYPLQPHQCNVPCIHLNSSSKSLEEHTQLLNENAIPIDS
jgi:hypothetical protein